MVLGMIEEESEEQKKQHILAQLKQKMSEIKALKAQLKQDDFLEDTTPTEAHDLIEEIEVPSLRALKDKKNQQKTIKKE